MLVEEVLDGSFNLMRTLKETPDGQIIIKYYNSKKKFLPKQRKMLVKLVLDKMFSMKNKFSVNERYEIARQISLVFLTELSVSVFLI